ncbi:hypothetical protein IOLA_012 [uncultured bacterium]|nr:hypothetical protein IOLA_012 [uncultured bacterium]
MSIDVCILDEINSISYNDKLVICKYIMEIMEINYNTDKLKIYTNEQLNLFLCKNISLLVDLIDEYDN